MKEYNVIYIVELLQPHTFCIEQRYFCLDMKTAKKYEKHLKSNGFLTKISNHGIDK